MAPIHLARPPVWQPVHSNVFPISAAAHPGGKTPADSGDSSSSCDQAANCPRDFQPGSLSALWVLPPRCTADISFSLPAGASPAGPSPLGPSALLIVGATPTRSLQSGSYPVQRSVRPITSIDQRALQLLREI